MNPTVVTFIALVVAVLILMWGAIELGRRYTSRKKKVDTKTINNWVTLKPNMSDLVDNPLPLSADEDIEERTESDLHTRAKQNGHYSQSKKPL